MRLLPILCLLVVLGQPSATWAQAGTSQTPPASPVQDAGVAPPTETSEPLPPDGGGDAGAGSPSIEPEVEPAAPGGSEAAAPQVAPPAEPEANIPTPGELGDRLVGDLPPPVEQKSGWTAPSPILTLHGYLRVRGELMDSFWLGRLPHAQLYNLDSSDAAYAGRITRDGLGPDPFTRFRPLERQAPQTACGDEKFSNEAGLGNVCDVDTLQFASLRFRLSPQINISEDIRIKSTFDIFDNMMLGSGPVSYYGAGRTTDAIFTGTNAVLGNMIVPRRAWAEVRNRDLGELRFGVMPEHWGTGLLYNAGNGLDDDFSTDLGRVQGTTKLAGFYLSASYDFMAEGIMSRRNEYRPDFDGSQLDDLDQFTFSVVRRVPDEDEESVLARGDALLNGGVHFQLRHQDSVFSSPSEEMMTATPTFQNRMATLYTPDIWGQLRYGKLRLEVEAAWIVGRMKSLATNKKQSVSMFGAAFESELRLVGDKLGLYFYSGAATGDSQTEGLSSDADYFDASGRQFDNTLVSTFRFHPAYRVDMILWRNIMRQVSGAYYFKPGVSYDFVRDNFGQLFGARVDLIYSRATSPIQTWGNDANLGVELNAQVYWRSDDGPDVSDGYHAALQYGVLFPLRGLGYYYRDAKLETAQTLRLLLGVVF
jgi:uncharacterized protein (TIGR04551 family)